MYQPAFFSFPARARRLLVVGLLLPVSALFAADEACTTCGGKVAVSGDFAHRKEPPSPPVAGNPANFEDVNGPRFAVTVSNLPAGRYTIAINAAETTATAAGERVYDVTAGEQVLAKDYDLFVAAGGHRKAATISGTVEKSDDALRGPLQLVFTASKGHAKFNTVSIKDQAGAEVVAFAASDLADAYARAAMIPPEVKEPAIWRDPAQPLRARADDLIRRMSLAEKVAQLKNAAPAIPRLGLPAYDYWNEALHGVANNGAATVFPQSVGAASSWNPELFRREGAVIGVEGRAKFNDYANAHNGDSRWWAGLTYWTPNVNIFRDPRWGRGQETYGEDPFLTAEIGIQFVKGIQGDDPNYMLAMACAKHFAVHSGPEPARHRFNAVISERDLYDNYLPQFERLVREGKVAGVMSAYNAINGVPVSADASLLTGLLRQRWGFEGYVVSDCDAIRDIYAEGQHHYVKTAEEAAAVAVKAGTNLCCGGDYNALVRAVQQGLITEKEIDGALYHTLWTRFRLGLFDPAEKVPFSKYTLLDNDIPAHDQVALELARQSIVLLKNNGVLPLDRSKLKQLAVIGPNAASKSMLEGNYHGTPSRSVSILDGIRNVATKDFKVTYAMGSPITTKTAIAPWSGQDNTTNRSVAELKAEALEQAAQADAIVYVGGITAAQEGESFDRESIELPPEQEDLIRALHATGKPVIMVNCSGSAMALAWEDANLPAIVQAWYPGQNGGRAVAEVLFGLINPSGHLPVTFYRSTADLPDFNDYSMRNRTYRYFTGQPLYAFGHGLSYTSFAYTNLRAIPAAGGALTVTLDIANTGARAGDHVVQLYATPPAASQPQEIRALCGFTRVHLDAGEKRTVTITVPAIALRRWNVAAKDYTIPAGEWTLGAGASSADIRQTATVSLSFPSTVIQPMTMKCHPRSRFTLSPSRRARLAGVALLAATLGLAAARAETGLRITPDTPAKLYPLTSVRLLDGSPFAAAVKANRTYVLALEPDRLLAPFRREAGLPSKAQPYGNWESGGLDGHTAGHYLSALADMIAAGEDTPDGELRRRLDYMVGEMRACQVAAGDGYVGGVPGSRALWTAIAGGDIPAINRKWVPWYNLHKTFAGLRDAYLEAGSAPAREVLVALGDWTVNLASRLSDSQMQQMLEQEHGGMNEVLADIYAITGDRKYLVTAERFNHRALLGPLEQHEDRLTGKHANTQIPKVVGFERIATLTGDQAADSGSRFFWETVTQHRSVAFGGNSVAEHFNDPHDFRGLLLHREGPETCNTYNMLRLTEGLFASGPVAAYADYYERALYNHILASINPDHPGYVYFTPIRPDHYRVYSVPGEGFWCCVGTGMENPGRYGQFIYARARDGIYVNLFIASELQDAALGVTLRQDTAFPEAGSTRLTLKLAAPKTFTLHLRQPGWVAPGAFRVQVNGVDAPVTTASSSYVAIHREWREGDQVEITLPMRTTVEGLPDGSPWYAILRGPIVLVHPSGTWEMTGLRADDSRMAHVAAGPEEPLDQAPALLAAAADIPAKVVADPAAGPLHFRLVDIVEPAVPAGLALVPFFRLHDSRYQMYWETTTREGLVARREQLVAAERARAEREAATLDWLAPGEQQPEVEHAFRGEDTQTGLHNGRHWRHGKRFQYTLNTRGAAAVVLSVTYSGDDTGRTFDILANGTRIATQTLTAERRGEFVEKSYALPTAVLAAAPEGRVTIAFVAREGLAGGVFDVRLLRPTPPRNPSLKPS